MSAAADTLYAPPRRGMVARFLGSRFVGEETLNRFYILHCVAIPLVVSLLIAIHFWRVRKDGGISQPL